MKPWDLTTEELLDFLDFLDTTGDDEDDISDLSEWIRLLEEDRDDPDYR